MTSKHSTLTQKRLKELLHYDPETGIFTWLVQSSSRAKIGQEAGYSRKDGYVLIRINYTKYLAHRLVFLYMEGEWPPNEVDHKKRITHDNRWKELRHATPRENQENRANNNDFIGVGFDKAANKWYARAAQNKRKRQHLGFFKTHLAASYARWAHDHR